MDRRTFLAAVAGTAGAVTLGSCSGGQQQAAAGRPTLRFPGEDSGFPSPFTYMRGPGYIQTSFIYDTLLWKDSTGRELPWLAESYEASADGTTYTFRLRDGVRWHDGRPLTADDVAFTYRYFTEQDLSPQVIISPIPVITDVAATDKRTVRFRLSQPAATFLGFSGAGAVPIVPQHIWSKVSDAATASDPAMLVGSGPYRLKSYSPGEGSYLYTANDDFFLGRPYVARIENRPVSDELEALLAGELDEAGASGARPEALAPFRDNPEYRSLRFPPGSSLQSLYWNIAKGGALADPRFRRACARAIDREDLVQRLFGGNGTPGSPGWVPPEHPFHVDVEQYPFDPGAANQQLDAAGYRRGAGGIRRDRSGRPLSFTLLATSSGSGGSGGGAPPVLDLLVTSLRRVGVQLTPQVLDKPTFNKRVIGGDAEMSVIASGGMNSDIASDYLRLVYSSQTKITQHAQGYANPEVDRLAAEQLRTLDEARRKEICAELQRTIAADLPVLPLFYPDSTTIVRTAAFQPWYVTPGGVAGTVPTVENKHALVTGSQTGMKIRGT